MLSSLTDFNPLWALNCWEWLNLREDTSAIYSAPSWLLCNPPTHNAAYIQHLVTLVVPTFSVWYWYSAPTATLSDMRIASVSSTGITYFAQKPLLGLLEYCYLTTRKASPLVGAPTVHLAGTLHTLSHMYQTWWMWCTLRHVYVFMSRISRVMSYFVSPAAHQSKRRKW